MFRALEDARAGGTGVRGGGEAFALERDRERAGRLAEDSPLDLLMIRYNAAHPGAERDIFPHLAKRQPHIVAYTATSWRQAMEASSAPPRGRSTTRGSTPTRSGTCRSRRCSPGTSSRWSSRTTARSRSFPANGLCGPSVPCWWWPSCSPAPASGSCLPSDAHRRSRRPHPGRPPLRRERRYSHRNFARD